MIGLARTAGTAALILLGLGLGACGGGSVPIGAEIRQPQVALSQPHYKAKRCATKPCIYVVNAPMYPPGSVTVYAENASGNAAPVESLSGSSTGLNDSVGVALDAGHNLYVANYRAEGTGDVTVYAAGSHGNAPPIATIGSQPSGDVMDSPSDVGLDAGGNIYVSAWTSNSVSVYAPGASGDPVPIQYIAGSNTNLNEPSYLAVTRNGTIYVANFKGASVSIYAAGASGNVAPIRMISGAATGLYHCTAIALDRKGNIYVTNAGFGGSEPPSITVYRKEANGDAAPIRTISGSKTDLNQPNGITLDSSSNIYVTDVENQSVYVYAKGTNGNIAPIRTISGKKTLIDNPSGIIVQ